MNPDPNTESEIERKLDPRFVTLVDSFDGDVNAAAEWIAEYAGADALRQRCEEAERLLGVILALEDDDEHGVIVRLPFRLEAEVRKLLTQAIAEQAKAKRWEEEVCARTNKP